MSLKPQLEAIIYAAETPFTLEQIIPLVKDSILAETPGIDPAEIRSRVRESIEELIADYSAAEHGIEIRQVAGGYRMSTKPEQHDVVRAFAKSLKPPFRLSLPALETLAVIAYKQPVTVPEISEIRGVDSGGVIATLLDRKLITTGGRKAVIGRPILYKTSKEFLLRFGLKDIHELPSMEEFEKLLAESFQSDLLAGEAAPVEATSSTAEASTVENSAESSGELADLSVADHFAADPSLADRLPVPVTSVASEGSVSPVGSERTNGSASNGETMSTQDEAEDAAEAQLGKPA